MKKRYLVLFLLNLISYNIYSQSATCAGADPFCAGGSALTFPNTVNQPSAEAGLDYDCLFTQPNPAWFYMQISTAGQLDFHIHQQNGGGTGLDVDFIAWGPFATPICGSANLNAGSEVACSYSAAPDEDFTISNAQVGEIYMLLITNFSNQAGQISLTQTNGGAPGAGATDCNIVCPLSITGAAVPCPQTTLTAVYLNASAPTFQWYDASGPISGATGATLTVSVPGDYTVIANSPGCYANATATVNVPAPSPPPITQPPAGLTECSGPAVTFDLTQNDEAYMGLNPSDYAILGYYTNGADAQIGAGTAIGSPTTYAGTNGQTIYISIEDENGGCISVVPFTLTINDCGPIAPPDQVVCDDPSNDGIATFDLASLIPGILGSHSPADFSVTFHLTQAEADSGANPIPAANLNAYQNVTPGLQVIYIRMEDNSDPTLYGTTTFQLIVNPQPATPNPADVTVCDSYTLPALGAGQTYHAGTSAGPVIAPGTAITTTQTIVILAESGTTPNCTAEGDFVVTVNITPPAPTPADVTACDSYVLPALPAGQTYHAGSAVGAVIAPLTAITTTQTIFIVAETGTTPNCSSNGSFVVTINVTPPAPTPADVTVCDSYTLPALGAGQTYRAGTSAGPVIASGTAITTTQTIVILAETGTTPNCTSEGDFVVTVNVTPPAPTPADVTACDSYVLPALPAGQTYHAGSAVGAVIAPLTAITTTQTIFIVAETGTTPNCSSNGSFVVTINVTPPAPTPADVTVCDSYTLPALGAGQTYHAGTSAGPVIAPGTAITTTQTIVILAETGTTPNCTSEGDFVVTVNVTPPAPTPADVTACDSYVLPALPAGQTYHAGSAVGTVIAPLTAITTTQTIFIVAETGTTPNCSSNGSFVVTINVTPPAPTPADVTVCDSYTLPALGAGQTYRAGTSAGPVIASGTAITTTQTIVILAETGTTPNCTSEGDFVVTVNHTPVADAPANVVACNSYTLPGLNVGEYYDGPNGSGNHYVANQVITAAHTTMYVYAETGTTPNCTSQNTFDIDIFFSPVITAPSDLNACDDNNDGFSCLFDLPGTIPSITGGNAGLVVTFHETLTDAQTGANPINTSSLYCNIVANDQTIYARVYDPAAPSCASTTSFMLHVHRVPVANAVITDYELCDVNNPGDGVEVFNLPIKNLEILNGQTGVNVTFYESQAAAQAGSPAIANISTYTNTGSPEVIWVRLQDAVTGCFGVGSFRLVVNPLPLVFPKVMNACGTSSGIAEFNLTTQDLEVSGGVLGMAVTYYETQAAAQAGSPQIATPAAYTNTTPNMQIVYARVENTITHCFSITTVTLTVTTGPAANTPAALQVCDPNNDCFAGFDLTDAINDIFGGPVPAGVSVTFHETMTDAQTGATFIANPSNYTNIVCRDQDIYVAVTYDATGCRSVVVLHLHVNDTPQGVEIDPLQVCDDDTDGIGTFDLNAAIPSILGSLDAAQNTVTFYETQAAAQAGTPVITNVLGYHNTTPGAQSIWVRVEDNTTHCFDVLSIDLIVSPKPSLPPTPTGAAVPMTKCDDNNPGDEQEVFDLTSAIPGILNGQLGVSVTFYETQAAAQAGTPQVNGPTAYTNTPNAQTLWVRMENDATHCFVLTTMDLRVEPLPVLIPPDGPIVECDPDGDGFAIFDLDALVVPMLQGVSGITVTFHETMTDAQNGNNAIVGSNAYLNNVPFVQPLYVRAKNDVTGCVSVMMIELNVIASPTVPPLEDLSKCDEDANNQDGHTNFNLTLQDAVILAAQSGPASDYLVSYYLTQADAQAGVSPIIPASNFINSTNPQTIWVRITAKNTECFNVGSFQVKVSTPLALTTPTQLSICDDGPTSAVPTAEFDLTVKEAELMGGTIVSGYTVAYYLTQGDAQGGINPISDPAHYTNIANAQTLFVVVTGPGPSFCRSFTTLTIRVLPLPVPKTDPLPLEACDDDTDGIAIFDLTQNEDYIRDNDPQLAFAYFATLADAQAGTPAIVPATAYPTASGTIYIRVERNTEPNYLGDFCYTIVEQQVIVNPLPVVQDADLKACDPAAASTYNFDLHDADGLVLGAGQDVADFTFDYYHNLADAQGGVNQITNDTSYPNTTNPETVVVRVTNKDTGCMSYATVTLKVLAGATAANVVAAAVCDTDTDGVMPVTLTDFDAQVLGAQDPAVFTVAYFASQGDALAGTSALASPYDTASGVLYAVVTNTATDCRSTPATVTLSIEPLVDITIHSDTPDGISNTICVDFNTGALLSGLTLLSGLPDDGTYTFQWTLGGSDIAGATGATYTITDPAGFGTYTVVATSALGCVSTSHDFVVLQSGPAVVATGTNGYAVSHYFEDHQTITISVTGYGTYQYQLDEGPLQDSNVFDDVPPGVHTVHVYDVEGDGTQHCDVFVISGIQTVNYPHFFTPNGDGINDTWNIIGLDSSAKIYIYDRYGKFLKEISPIGTGWNGTYNGEPLPSTDYWFTVDYPEINTANLPVMKEFKAHFSLKR